MQKAPKTLVIIPAYNKERSIADVINPLKKAGHDVLVVNDASTDKTGKVAEVLGVKVVNLPKNAGKGGAFLEGLGYAYENKYDVIVTLDADLKNSREIPVNVGKMVHELWKDPVVKMVIAPSVEGAKRTGKEAFTISGQRAFKVKAFTPIFKGKKETRERNRKFLDVRYGLEQALNTLFYYHTPHLTKVMDNVVFAAKEAFRHSSDEIQLNHMLKAADAAEKRKNALARMKEKRAAAQTRRRKVA